MPLITVVSPCRAVQGVCTLQLSAKPACQCLRAVLTLKADDHCTELRLVLPAGETVFDWFTPAKLGHHRLLFTPALLFICWAVFFFMAGLFPAFELQTSPNASTVQASEAGTDPPAVHPSYSSLVYHASSQVIGCAQLLLCI